MRQLASIPPRDYNAGELPWLSAPVRIKVLPTMTLKILRAKALKTLKLRPSPTTSVRLWVILHGANHVGRELLVLRELDLESEASKEIDFWGVEEGSGIGVLLD